MGLILLLPFLSTYNSGIEIRTKDLITYALTD